MKTVTKRERQRLKRKIKYTYNKIKHCVKDLHHVVTKYLATNYKQVIIPNFRVKEMTAKKHNGKIRTLCKSTVKQMLNWSHYSFRQLLKYKMKRYGGSIHECTEEYTSMTCGKCGRLNHKLGGNKTFKCPHCDHIQDRDVNAARNIFIKNIRACIQS